MNFHKIIYIKKCNHCNLKYLGITKQDINKYKGSGKRWLNHIKYHNSKITTFIIKSFLNKNECIDFCMWFSKINNIIDSDKWANFINENGLDGKPVGSICSEETKKKNMLWDVTDRVHPLEIPPSKSTKKSNIDEALKFYRILYTNRNTSTVEQWREVADLIKKI